MGEERPDQERAAEQDRGHADPGDQRVGAHPHVTVGLQGEEGGPVQGEQRQRREAAEQRVRVEQGQQRAGELVVLVERDAAHDVREGHAPQQRGHRRARDDRDVPVAPPAVTVDLAPVLEGEAAHDERDEDEQQREVEAGEQARVPLGEGGEGRAARHEQPDLVAVPDRADGVDRDPAVVLGASDHGQQHADAEVEAFEDEVAGPEDGDEQEPDVGEFHGRLPSVRDGHGPRRLAVDHGRQRGGWGRPCLGVADHEHAVQHGEHAVEQREDDQRGQDRGDADRR